jgi:hypothetical protein
MPQRRDTAAGCRDRAASSMTHAGTMSAASDRRAIEDNAANWSAQALILQRVEDGARDAVQSTSLLISPNAALEPSVASVTD